MTQQKFTGDRLWPYAEIMKKFPIETRVKMNREGVKRFPEYAGRAGLVVGHHKRVAVNVLFDGMKTADGWHPAFLAPAIVNQPEIIPQGRME